MEVKNFQIKSDIEIKIEKENKMLNLINELCAYYRERPHEFAKDYLNIQLKPFQKILLYAMFHSDNVVLIAARGLGKSFIVAVYAVIKCILYPGSKICITSAKLKQAVEVLKKITNELCINNDWGSDLLNAEIKKILLNGEDPMIMFHNGSFIYAVAANKNARSKRSTDNVYDEYVQMNPDIIRDVLEPFLNVKRQVGFANNPRYANRVEEGRQFYLSSAWYKSEWSYVIVKDYITNMMLNKPYFACALPYQLSIESGLLSPARIKQVYESSDFNIIRFMMEYMAIWFGANGTEFFSYDDINARRNITMSYPITEFNNRKAINVPELKFNEERILSVDVALKQGKKNDAACLMINDAIPNSNNTYTANYMYIETHEGLRTEELGMRVMEMYYQYNCTVLVVDVKGNGMGVADFITKEQINPATGETYKAFKAVNDDSWAERCTENEFTETLWVINGTDTLNDQAAFRLKTGFESGKINLLLNEYDCETHLMNNIKGYQNMSEEMQLKCAKPYLETTLLVNEMINLEFDVKGSKVRLREKTGMRKDRYSSCVYNYWVMKELEKKLKHEDEKKTECEFMMKKPKTYDDNDYFYDRW